MLFQSCETMTVSVICNLLLVFGGCRIQGWGGFEGQEPCLEQVLRLALALPLQSHQGDDIQKWRDTAGVQEATCYLGLRSYSRCSEKQIYLLLKFSLTNGFYGGVRSLTAVFTLRAEIEPERDVKGRGKIYHKRQLLFHGLPGSLSGTHR